MSFLSYLGKIFTTVPFLAELILFMALSIPWIILKDKSNNKGSDPQQGLVRLLSYSIFIIGGLKIGLSTMYGKGFPVLMLITYLVCAVFVFLLSRFKFRFLVFVALCVSAGIYVIALNLFTNISITKTYQAEWKIQRPEQMGMDADAADYIQFNYKETPEYFDFIYSDQISTMLMIGKKEDVSLDVKLLYQWGLLVDHTIQSVEGIVWTPSRTDGAGIKGNSNANPPFPKYYLGFSK